MFCLHVSNRTENLLRHLTEIIRVDPQQDLFAPELFLIQSQGMERMIAQSLADEFRSFCNFQFFLPLDFLSFIAGRLDMGITPDGFQRQILTWRLDGLLRDLTGEVYEPLRYYVSGDNGELKRFQLARRVANVFDQYQLMRSDILCEWEKGKRATSHHAEGWQMDLWRRLLEQPGGEVHRGMLFRQVIERLKDDEGLENLLPKRISVIGLHTMPPIFLEYLNNLARHMSVHLFLLSPCRNYWGNVESKRARFKRGMHTPSGTPLEFSDDQHPLLAVLGRQGRDLQNLMLESADFSLELESYAEPVNEESAVATLLDRVQHDLLNGTLPGENIQPLSLEDTSIQLMSCHSKLREMSVLKDHLLELLHNDPHLELRDIVVMAPDIQEYGALIPAVFEDIQHSIADRSLRRRNSVIAAFLSFLDLFKGRFGWREVMDLLQQQVVFSEFQLSVSDLDSLRQWVVDAGIRWGLSGKQRQENGLPEFDEGSWRSGLDRLLMGYAIDSENFVDGLLPYGGIEGRGAQPLGVLCQFVELLDRAYLEFRQNRTVSGWSEILLTFVTDLFGESLEKELVELRALLAELGESVSAFHTSALNFGVIRDWLTQLAKESRSSTGFLRGQLTFCSMLPMRSIPFPVVCLVGLDEGVFPKNDFHDTFDLMGTDFRAGDRSPRADDRYQFLEALLAARSHLYLSYIGQSIRTNEELSPSVVVTEFLEVLETSYGVEDLTVRHPLHPFSKRYFDQAGDQKLFSYNDYCCQIATTLKPSRGEKGPWWQGQLERTNAHHSLSEIFRFYKNPQRYFIQNCLGIRLDEGEDQPEERELFELTGLAKYHVEQDLVQSALSGTIAERRLRMQVESRWPLGNSGNLVFDKKRADIEEFAHLVQAQEMGARAEDLQVDITAGKHRLTGRLSNLYEKGALLLRYGKLRGADLLFGWLHHLALCSTGGTGATTIVSPEKVIHFSSVQGDEALAVLLDLFTEGNRAPSQFFVEPAHEYARHALNKRSRTLPLVAAMKVFDQTLEKGYEPEWALLFRGSATLLDMAPDFERLCNEVMCPILEAADE